MTPLVWRDKRNPYTRWNAALNAGCIVTFATVEYRHDLDGTAREWFMRHVLSHDRTGQFYFVPSFGNSEHDSFIFKLYAPRRDAAGEQAALTSELVDAIQPGWRMKQQEIVALGKSRTRQTISRLFASAKSKVGQLTGGRKKL